MKLGQESFYDAFSGLYCMVSRHGEGERVGEGERGIDTSLVVNIKAQRRRGVKGKIMKAGMEHERRG